jgi:hypothetical protein
LTLYTRTKTLHALRELDPARKILLIQLLIDSDVQNCINLSHVDLSSLIFPPGSFYNQLRFVNVLAFSSSILDESLFS